MHESLTPLDKKHWLQDHFGGVVTRLEVDHFVSGIPRLYESVPNQNSSRDPVRGIRARTTINLLEGIGSTEPDSWTSLFQAVVTNASRNREVRIFQPKEGQNPGIIQNHQVYDIIEQDDVLHDHASLKLADFSITRIFPDTLGILKIKFDTNHTHILVLP